MRDQDTICSGFPQEPPSRVRQILNLFGSETVLVPVATGTKVPIDMGYPDFDHHRMSDPVHLAKLEHGNIGILTGPNSGNLNSIDFDTDAASNEFLKLNPEISMTTRSRGARGGNLWLRLIGEYPQGVVKLTDAEGRAVGEWRAGRCITVVSGRHPDGCDYQIDAAFPVREVEFTNLRWPESWKSYPGRQDPYDNLVAAHGPPYIGGKGRLELNEDFVVAWIRSENDIVHAVENSQFYLYDDAPGYWIPMSPLQVNRLISGYLKRIAEEGNDARLRVLNKTSVVNSIRQHLAAEASEKFMKGCRPPGWRPVLASNTTVCVILPGSDTDPQVRRLPNSPVYRFLSASPVSFVESAECPRFLNQLLAPVLCPEDIQLLQKLFGLILVDENEMQKIVVLEGAEGVGKSVLAQILKIIVGEKRTTELRTRHLDSRFETARYADKRLLLGSDVRSDFLKREGASLLKALTGGDLIGVERKGVDGSDDICGALHVLITSNSSLQIRVDGDEGAWKRRLVIIKAHKPAGPPARRVLRLAETLVREEGSGILNWLLEGAIAAHTDVQVLGDLFQTPEQRRRVDDRIGESDSVGVFVADRLIPTPAGGVTSQALREAYGRYCRMRGWVEQSERGFHTLVKDTLEARYGLAVRHSDNIMCEGKRGKGYRGVVLAPSTE